MKKNDKTAQQTDKRTNDRGRKKTRTNHRLVLCRRDLPLRHMNRFQKRLLRCGRRYTFVSQLPALVDRDDDNDDSDNDNDDSDDDDDDDNDDDV